MVLVDPDRLLAWEFSRAQPLGAGQWQASGVDLWDLAGPGWKQAFVGPSWWGVGSVASGLPFLAGVVRVEEVKAGVIPHALIVSCPSNRAKTLANGNDDELCSPAANTDGWGIGAHFIPEGARLQLDPNLDLDAFGLSQEAKVVARAMQTYGMYVGLNGPSFALYFQNLGPFGGEWATIPEVFDIIDLPTGALRVLETNTTAKDPGGSLERSVKFVSAPTVGRAGERLSPTTVRLVNAAGNPVYTGREFPIMIAIGMWEGTNPGGAQLLGTAVKTTQSGIATFDDLVIDQPGSTYRLFAMPQDLDYAVSAEILIKRPRTQRVEPGPSSPGGTIR